jgi:squalene-associated FAD-dependent desaturase
VTGGAVTGGAVTGIRVAVVGGGLAGITAALRCADAGAAVTLFEDRVRLGGLTYSFRRGDLDVDNGQHVFLRCCKAYRALLDRLGVTDQVQLQPRLDITVRRPGRPAARLHRSGLPAPAHLSATLLKYAPLSPLDRLRVIKAALALKAVDITDPKTDEQSFADWLSAHGQSQASISALWDLLIVATLNARSDQASLALAAKVFQTGLLEDAGAGDIGWSKVALQRLHGDAADIALGAAGVQINTSTRIEGLAKDGQTWTLTQRSGESHTADAVVLAVSPGAAERLLPSGAVDLAPGWSQQLGSVPIVNVHIVFDTSVMAEPFFAGVGTDVQWVFDRTVQSGLARGQYLAISLSAATAAVDMTTAEIRAWILPALTEVLPAARKAGVVDFFVTRERSATFAPAPGNGRYRPAAATSLPGLVLAGAWTDTGWPATMESAVLSGEQAARTVLNNAVTTNRTGTVAA